MDTSLMGAPLLGQVNEPKGPAGVVEVRKAFEYSVDRIGQAAGAGPLWQDYLNLLQQPRPGSAIYNALFGGGVAGQEDANRTAVLRWVLAFVPLTRASCN